MIKKLQHRFIRIALVSLATAMILVVLVVNAANWISVRNELRDTLSFLAENGGSASREAMNGRMQGRNRHARNLVSESRWFSVSFDSNGMRRNMNLLNMDELDEASAIELAKQALQSGLESGFLDDYLYQIQVSPRDGQAVLFLNCETKLAAVRNLALISGLACLAGIFFAFVAVALASRKAIEPTIRTMEQQKQFITNASHELKTPLTVISTNMELLQMEQPDNPWVKSTQKQAGQMRHLVDELVYLSRMEEENAPLVMETLSAAPLIRETAEPFLAMAEYQGKTMTVDAEDNLTLRGDRTSIQRLLSTLLDNAVKYSPEEGAIRVSARSEGRYVMLTVSNDVAQPLSEEQCRQLFDRFYRADPSRNKEKQNGFGIGLAIAAAIVEKHGGHISAGMEENRLGFSCRLPKGEKSAVQA
ncbi:MAG: GHKL domain-containing protein [Clostridia bacterium]|nr:GHKL domain-containing protein [Clostridia bacterium]